jgi:hypothetical protein
MGACLVRGERLRRRLPSVMIMTGCCAVAMVTEFPQ